MATKKQAADPVAEGKEALALARREEVGGSIFAFGRREAKSLKPRAIVTVDDGEARRYWKCEVGNGLEGIMEGIGHQKMDDESRDYLIVRVTQPTMADMGSGKEKTTEVYPPGTVVYANIRHNMIPLVDMYMDAVKRGEMFAVSVEPRHKEQVKGGRTVWVMAVHGAFLEAKSVDDE